MESCPLLVLGKLYTKAIGMLSHFHSGMSNGHNSLKDLICSAFTFLQVRHLNTYSTTSFFMPTTKSSSSSYGTSLSILDGNSNYSYALPLRSLSLSHPYVVHALILNLINPLTSLSNSNSFPDSFNLILS